VSNHAFILAMSGIGGLALIYLALCWGIRIGRREVLDDQAADRAAAQVRRWRPPELHHETLPPPAVGAFALRMLLPLERMADPAPLPWEAARYPFEAGGYASHPETRALDAAPWPPPYSGEPCEASMEEIGAAADRPWDVEADVQAMIRQTDRLLADLCGGQP
jgi:hypothetical protein